jgi:hypothetical protein
MLALLIAARLVAASAYGGYVILSRAEFDASLAHLQQHRALQEQKDWDGVRACTEGHYYRAPIILRLLRRIRSPGEAERLPPGGSHSGHHSKLRQGSEAFAVTPSTTSANSRRLFVR